MNPLFSFVPTLELLQKFCKSHFDADQNWPLIAFDFGPTTDVAPAFFQTYVGGMSAHDSIDLEAIKSAVFAFLQAAHAQFTVPVELELAAKGDGALQFTVIVWKDSMIETTKTQTFLEINDLLNTLHERKFF